MRLFTVAALVAAASGCGGGQAGPDARPDVPIDTELGCAVFPADNWWNQEITGLDVHPRSDTYIDSIGRSDTMHPDFGGIYQDVLIGIPYAVVPGDTPRVPVSFDAADESDPGPYPIPPNVPVEAGGDRHVVVIDNDDCTLYEMFAAERRDGGASWAAFSGAVFDLSSNQLRPDGWTSADAAGLPIFPGLVRYDEVVDQGVIDHALRFTASRTQSGYIEPARHSAGRGDDPDLPPMGLRLRMKASYDCSSYSTEVQVICTALKTYGMFLADNGSDWYLSGAGDDRWDDDALRDLKQIPGDAFEAVDTGSITPGL
jgi:hypothetical protein